MCLTVARKFIACVLDSNALGTDCGLTYSKENISSSELILHNKFQLAGRQYLKFLINNIG